MRGCADHCPGLRITAHWQTDDETTAWHSFRFVFDFRKWIIALIHQLCESEMRECLHFGPGFPHPPQAGYQMGTFNSCLHLIHLTTFIKFLCEGFDKPRPLVSFQKCQSACSPQGQMWGAVWKERCLPFFPDPETRRGRLPTSQRQ